jgi:hypothetical protein
VIISIGVIRPAETHLFFNSAGIADEGRYAILFLHAFRKIICIQSGIYIIRKIYLHRNKKGCPYFRTAFNKSEITF